MTQVNDRGAGAGSSEFDILYNEWTMQTAPAYRRGARDRFRSLAAGLLLAIAGVHAAAQVPDEEPVVPPVRVGAIGGFPPQFVDAIPGQKPAGFAIDVIESVARRAGIRLSYASFPDWQAMIDAFREDRIDVIPNLGATGERRAWARFTAPIETTAVRRFEATGVLARTITPEVRRQVAVVRGNLGETLVRQRPGTQTVVFDSLDAALVALLAGKVGALVFPDTVIQAVLRASDLTDRLVAVGEPLARTERAIAVRPELELLHARLDAALRAFKSTEEFGLIQRRWYGEQIPYWTVEQVASLGAAALLALALSMAGWRYRSLERMNRRLVALIDERDSARAEQERLALDQARLEMRERFIRRVIDGLLTFVAVLDRDGRVLEVNHASFSLAADPQRGRERPSAGARAPAVRGLPFWEYYWWNSDPGVVDEMRQACARSAAGETSRFDTVARTAGGGRIDVEVSLAPLRADGEVVTHIVASVIDLSDRRQALESMERARAEAEAASRHKSEFVANISHEIRTPLTAILGYADLLAARMRDGADRAAVATIARNGRHLLEIVNDLLDMSKLDAGRIEIHQQDFDPCALAADACSSMAGRAEEKGLRLRLDPAGAIPCEIRTDRLRVKQILLDLVGNAIKFTEAGEVRLQPWLDDADPSAGWLEFRVIDTGIGIAPDQLESIFEAFRQVDAEPLRRFEGTGLGLALARRFAGLLGAEVRVRSEPGAGSTFTLRLPVGDVRDVPRRIPVMTEPPPSPTAPPIGDLKGRGVFVAEDQPEVRALLERLCTGAGATVKSFPDGREAVAESLRAMAAGAPPDAIVMDIQMPVMGGLEAVQRMRAAGYGGPVIALTAGASTEDEARCRAAGCSDFQSKPFDGALLVERIASACGRPQELAPGAEHVAPDGIRVLVVDDSRDAASALAEGLQLLGHAVDVASSGSEAIARIERCVPQAMLVDLDMPGMSGIALLSRCRQMRVLDRTRIIALSGDADLAARSRAAGFDAWLLKPARLADVQRALDSVVASDTPSPIA